MANAILDRPDWARRRFALLRHEREIVLAGLRAVLRNRLDLCTVLIALPVLLLVLRAWSSGHSAQLLALQAFAAGLVVAFYAANSLLQRCEYHRTDGILAEYAQRPVERLRLALPLFAAAAAASFSYLAVVNANRPALWLAGTVLGAAAGLAWGHIGRVLREARKHLLHFPPLHRGTSRRIQGSLVAAGTVSGLACAFLPLGEVARMIAVTAISAAIGVTFGAIDGAAIRYMTMVGQAWLTIGFAHVAPLLAFFGPFAAALAMAPHWAPSALAALLGTGGAAFVASRVLACQSFGPRVAEWVVAALVGAVVILGFGFPPAAPVAMLIGLTGLVRRATSRTWLIA